MPLSIQPLNEANARASAMWRYEAPLNFYNLNRTEIEQNVQYFLDSNNHFYGIFEEQEFVGFCSFGEDGQVNGGDYNVPALDIGMGLRPDLIGKGRGIYYVEAVLNFAHKEFNPPMYRVTIAAFNQRALRVWSKAGFHPVNIFEAKLQGVAFVILVKTV